MSTTESGAVCALMTTFETEADAERAVRTLVERRLIACGNLIPSVRSIYRWQGEIESAGEVLGVLKTGGERLPELVEVLGRLHPYDVPEIVVLPVVAGGVPYLDWVMRETAGGAGTAGGPSSA